MGKVGASKTSEEQEPGCSCEMMANFPGQLGYFDKVELAFDNEPVLQAAARMAQTIRQNNGMEIALQPGKYYDKGRTCLAERMVQTVRNQQRH